MKKTIAALNAQADQINNETGKAANNHVRIGAMNVDLADSMLNEIDEGYVQVEYGSASNQAATIQAAIDTASDGDTLRFKDGIVKVETQINVNKQLVILGTPNTVFQTTSDISIYFVTKIKCFFADFRFLGDAGALGSGGKTAQYGIRVATSVGDSGVAYNVFADNMGGGLSHLRNVGITGDTSLGWVFSICRMQNCARGIWLDQAAEYTQINDCVAVQCAKGLFIDGGNDSVVGGNYSRCTDGIYIDSTLNGKHIISGVIAKHCTNNLNIIKTPTFHGVSITGGSFFTGNVKIKDADGVNFNGNTINGTVTVDGCATIWTGNNMVETAAETILNGGVLHKSNNFNYTAAKVLTAW